MTDEIADEIAKRHVEKSLAQAEDQDKVDQWASGERAKEDAVEIASLLLQQAEKRLEERSDDNAS